MLALEKSYCEERKPEMAPKLLEKLEAGLKRLKRGVEDRRKRITAKLKRQQEIYDAVMEARAAREEVDTKGGDDVDEEPITNTPKPLGVRKALATITDYLLVSEEPYARQLEGLLGRMKHDLRVSQSRTMKTTKMTDYFTTK